MRDRLTVGRDLLTDSGSIFVQIGDKNVHRVRALLDEVFGNENYVSEILVKKKGSQFSGTLEPVNDFILMYARSIEYLKFRKLWLIREDEDLFDDFPYVELDTGERLRISTLAERDGVEYQSNLTLFRDTYPGARVFALNPLKSGGFRRNQSHDFQMHGRVFPVGDGQCWKHTVVLDDGETPGMTRLLYADRLYPLNRDVRFVRYSPSPSIKQMSNWWDSLGGAPNQVYVVQTNPELVKRCILMSTDPGDLVLDPTCGSGTTAYAAEQWGRRWITIDTSRVALALARARIMGARYPYYLLADSLEGQKKEAEASRAPPKGTPTHGDIRQGFVYDRARSGSSGAIANNAEIDVIWERWQEILEPLRARLNAALGRTGSSLRGGEADKAIPSGSPRRSAPRDDNRAWEEWQIPREAAPGWPADASKLHADWWSARIERQKEIDASIAAKAEFEYLYDKPYIDTARIRVAGPFTAESLSPHRVLAVDADDSLIDTLALAEDGAEFGAADFVSIVLENLKTAGVQQAHKEDRITFTSLVPWPGQFVCAEGRYLEGDQEARSAGGATGKEPVERRAAIFLGPEFGTVSRPDLVAAAREAADARFDVVIACAFNFDAHSSEFERLGRIPILKARMNADLHMAGELKSTGSGNLFVVFGEPDIEIEPVGRGQIQVKIKGVDVFHPQTGEVVSGGPESIALWFIDTDYNEESFFVRHAYFLGAETDPYKALKTTLKAEIDEEAWASLRSDTSRPFPKPKSGRIAVKVINHLGDEVMKVFAVA